MNRRTTIKPAETDQTTLPPPTAEEVLRHIVDIDVNHHPADTVPPLEFLLQARRSLLAEQGPCAAAKPELLLATARELARRGS